MRPPARTLRPVLFALAAFALACDGGDVGELATGQQGSAEIDGLFFLQGIQPVRGTPGTEVQVHGLSLTENLEVKVQGQGLVDVDLKSSRKATFKVPENAAGMTNIVVQQNEAKAVIPFLVLNHKGYPLFSGPADEYCRGEKFQRVSGEVVAGTKDCPEEDDGKKRANEPALVSCKKAGETDCRTTKEYPALEKSQLSPKIFRAGVTINGVSGKTAERPDECHDDLRRGCVATEGFPAVDVVNELENNREKILAGTSILGVSGTLEMPAGKHVSQMVGTFGINGDSTQATLSLPLPKYVHSMSESYGVGGEWKGSLTLPPSDQVLSSAARYGVGGDGKDPSLVPAENCASEGDDACVVGGSPFVAAALDSNHLDHDNIRNGTLIGGVTGEYTGEEPPECSRGGEAACLANSPFVAADMSMTVPDHVKTGVELAGVKGTYSGGPSVVINKPGSQGLTAASGDTVQLKFALHDPVGEGGSVSLFFREGTNAGCSSAGISHWSLIEEGAESPKSWTPPPPSGNNEAYYICGRFTDSEGTVAWGWSMGGVIVGEPDAPCTSEGAVWQTGDGACKNTELSLVFSSGDPKETWNDAKQDCESRLESGYSDWRLPTESEFIGAVGDGLSSFVDFYGNADKRHWTTTLGEQNLYAGQTNGCEETLEYQTVRPASGSDGWESDECEAVPTYYVCVRKP